MTTALTEDEVDKTVVDSDGTELGTVVDLHHGTAHVSADPTTVEEMQTRPRRAASTRTPTRSATRASPR